MIRMFKVAMSENASREVGKTLVSGMIGEGPKVEEFKKALEDRFSCRNLILLNSGTSALTLALRAADCGPGDEVITTPFTMIATNVAIKAVGAKPVFADIEEDSVNISTDSIYKKINRKTKAVIVTLVGGVPCDLEDLIGLNIPVIIDAAHAIDTYYKGEHISHWGDYVCFSFQSIKQLTTGDGGAIVINKKKKLDLIERLKWFGMSRKVPKGKTRLQHQMTADVKDWGYKMHMNDIAATIGLANLENLDMITYKQRENANYYNSKLPKEILPTIDGNSLPSWWAYYILIKNRKKFMKFMENEGIETTPMWRRNDEYSCFRKAKLPNMDKLQNKIVFIPVGWWLTQNERRHIVESIIRFYKAQGK